MERATKIVATAGPASSGAETLAAMIAAGVDVVRLNLSHGERGVVERVVRTVRAIQTETEKPVAVIADLQGPKIRIGALPEPLVLAPGFPLRLSMQPGHSGPDIISCDYTGLARDLRPGDRLYLRDGMIELQVQAIRQDAVDTVARTGGTLTSRAGINAPGVSLSLPVMSEQDAEDLAFAAGLGVDYVALSFVRSAADVVAARERLTALGADTGIIAKLENREALHRLTEILRGTDGVMVARGDMGVEVGPENVPIWQRRIIAAAGRALVPVITATQMLESMIENPRPTRAEASDVANAVWDGSDALMLSAETAVGLYPVETVAMMDRIIRSAETERRPEAEPQREGQWGSDPSRSVSWAAREIIAHDTSVRAVVAFTVNGYSARLIAKDRIPTRLLALTTSERVRQRLALLWGVQSVRVPEVASERELLRLVDEQAQEALGCTEGDVVVVVGSMPVGGGGPTNFLKIHELGEGAAE